MCVHGHPSMTQVSMCACIQTDATRTWIQSPSIHPYICVSVWTSIYI